MEWSQVSFRRTMKRNCTREETLKKVDDQNGAVLAEWDEEFQSLCNFSGYKVNVFHPWEVNFTVYHGSNQGVKNKISALGSGALNLAEYVHKFMWQDTEVEIPLTVTNTTESRNMLYISLRFMEMKAAREPIEVSQSSAMAFSAASDACFVEKDEVSALKASLRRVKILTEYISARRAKKTCHEDDSEGRGSKSKEGEYSCSYDPESDEEFDGGESEGKNSSGVRNLLATDHWHLRIMQVLRILLNADSSHLEELASTLPEEPIIYISKRSILPWRKRKMSFKSPTAVNLCLKRLMVKKVEMPEISTAGSSLLMNPCLSQ